MVSEAKCYLRLCDVGVGFDGRRVLRSFQLEVFGEEVVALVGPSGSGKSTVLRLAAGVIEATEGTVKWPGRDGGERPYRPLAFVEQGGELPPWLSARSHVSLLNRLVAGEGKVEARRKAEDQLKDVGLPTSMWELRPGELSGGSRARVAIAATLAISSELTLLDEPLEGIDWFARRRLVPLLREKLVANGGAAVYVTHDLEEAILVSDRVVALVDPRNGIYEAFNGHSNWTLRLWGGECANELANFVQAVRELWPR